MAAHVGAVAGAQVAAATAAAQLQAALEQQCVTVEAASRALAQSAVAAERAAAEQVLQRLGASARPYNLCRAVMKRAATPTAVFHAVSAIKQAVLREWALLPREETDALRNDLLSYALTRADKLMGDQVFVLNQLMHVTALMYKRAWLSPHTAERAHVEAVLTAVRGLLTTPDATHNRHVVALKLISALLNEFASSRAANLGMSWEYHIKCHRSMEAHCLQPLFAMAVSMLTHLTGSLSKGGKWDPRVGSECLKIVEDVLGWEFQEHVSDTQLALRAMKAPTAASEAVEEKQHQTVHPGAGWSTLLIRDALVDGVAQAYLALRATTDRSTVHRMREILIQFASIDGQIFADSAAAGAGAGAAGAAGASAPAAAAAAARVEVNTASLVTASRVAFLSRLVKVCSALLDAALASAQALHTARVTKAGGNPSTTPIVLSSMPAELGDEMLGICRLYTQLVTTHGLRTILRLPNSSHPQQQPQQPQQQPQQSEGQVFLRELTKLTTLLPLTDSATWTAEAYDIALDGWMTLITQFDEFCVARTTKPADAERVGLLLREFTRVVFGSYLERRMAVARADALRTAQHQQQNGGKEDDDDGDDDERFADGSGLEDQLSAVAIVARLNADTTLPQLSALIADRTKQLKAFSDILAKQPQRQPTPQQRAMAMVLHEELYRLIQLMGYVLADPSHSETPTPPRQLLMLSARVAAQQQQQQQPPAQAAAADPLVLAANSVFGYIAYENAQIVSGHAQPHTSCVVSPLVAQTAVAFLERWLSSYLMLDSLGAPVPPTLITVWGAPEESGGDSGLRVLEAVVQKAWLNLSLWPGEWRLAELTCELIHALVNKKKIRPHLAKMPSWAKMVQAYATGDNKSPIMRLRESALATLVQAMCYAAAEAPPAGLKPLNPQASKEERIAYEQADAAARATAFNVIVTPIGRRLQQVLQMPEFEKHRADPQVLRQLVLALEMMHGVARSTGMYTYHMAFGFLSQYFTAFVQLIGRYHDREEVVKSVLTLLCDMAESEIQFLDGNQSVLFMRTCVAVVTEFGKIANVRLSRLQTPAGTAGAATAAARQLQEEESDDQLEDVHTLLRLLGFIRSKDGGDSPFAVANPYANPSQPQVDAGALASDATLNALCWLLPHVSKLLAHPNIASTYFQLLASLLAVHPDKFANLPPASRNAMLQSIASAITSQSMVNVQRSALQALQALAAYHVSTIPAVQRARHEKRVADWTARQERDRKLRDARATSGPPAAGRGGVRRMVKLSGGSGRSNALSNSTGLTAPKESMPSAGAAASVSPQRLGGGAAAAAAGAGAGASAGAASAASAARASPMPQFVPKPESPFEKELVSFQGLCIKLIVLDAVSGDLVDAVADALLPLILTNYSHYQQSVQAFVNGQLTRFHQSIAAAQAANATQNVAELQAQAAMVQQRLTQGFVALTESNGLSRTDDTPANRQIFRKNLRTFVQAVRSFIQTK